MVVRIKNPHSLQRALNYNEQKVQKGQAECIAAGNYLLAPHQMNFHQKMERLQELISRNERSKKSNTLHISINFDPSEIFQKGQLIAIAGRYMEKIGFAEQPYLVYTHNDAAHPHLHIVTTNIQADGKRIDTYNIGRNQSEIARKEIEEAFGLVRATGRGKMDGVSARPIDVQKVQYGKSETKRSITNVLDLVVNQFKYTSLPELNAVLQLYNVVADRGTETSVIYQKGGMQYRLLDSDGHKIGVPIKASSIHNKPTLSYLENRFTANLPAGEKDKAKLRATLDWVLSKKPVDLNALISALKKEKIETSVRKNKEGLQYGITFIDFRTKAVFKGSDIGKGYSIAGLESKIKQQLSRAPKDLPNENPAVPQIQQAYSKATTTEKDLDNQKSTLLQELLDPEKNLNRLSPEWLRKKRKKRNKNL